MILIRVYFFLGLVAATIFAILLSIADPSTTKYLRVAQWALIGLLAACVPIILAIEGFLIKKGWLTSKENTGSQLKGKARIGWMLLKPFVIALFVNTTASLLVSLLYGEQAFRILVAERAALHVMVVFTLAAISSFVLAKALNGPERE